MIYLDNAATTFPKPERVYREAERVMRECGGNPGRGSHALALAAAEEIYRCREAVADLFDGEPDRVVLTPNATAALNLALKGLLRPGDHVLTSALAHNSVRRPLHDLERDGVMVEEYPVFPRGECLAAIRRMIRPNTRVIEVTVRSNVVSVGLPLYEIAALCKGRSITLVVDASQGAGAMPISLGRLGRAVICAPGHKGLYGLSGSGFALFSKDVEAKDVRPLLSGGSGLRSMEPEMPDLFPERLEAGTLNAPAAASLRAGIEAIREIGVEEIDYRERMLRRRLVGWLAELRQVQVYLPYADEGSIVLFSIRGKSAAEVGTYLDGQSIAVRAGLHCAPMAHRMLGTPEGGAVRASLGMFTTEADLAALIRALREL
jgi:cysteine desulfurase family protein